MKVLVDTNVVLDVLLDRFPFRDAASRILAEVERGSLVGVLGATTLTTIHYLVEKASGEEQARVAVRDLVSLFQIAPVDREVLERAVNSPITDFEDAVLHEAGVLAKVDAVVTRDPSGFHAGTLPVLSPQELRATF